MYLKNQIIFFFHISLFRFVFVDFVLLSLVSFYFVSFRFVFVDFVSFRFYFVSHFIGTPEFTPSFLAGSVLLIFLVFCVVLMVTGQIGPKPNRPQIKSASSQIGPRSNRPQVKSAPIFVINSWTLFSKLNISNTF